MNSLIKKLIIENKAANSNITELEDVIKHYTNNYITFDKKTRVNYGNLCIALKGYRMIADATECLLLNENCLKDTNGEFYQKVDVDSSETDTESIKDTDNAEANCKSPNI